MRFGWFDFIDDLEVSKALLNTVETIGREHQLNYAEGPVGFSNLDKVGVMTEGFDHIATMITWYNHPYYVNHYKHMAILLKRNIQKTNSLLKTLNLSFLRKHKNLLNAVTNLEP